ncbi:MAG: alpha/beta hydrolase [Proteobacteria bacterium]|nr:alpha/beta hydrolase [Pseudomonadota bacterium]MBU1716667.1 alpha/beta hydrolase [Pseudomonadota bacterium]
MKLKLTIIIFLLLFPTHAYSACVVLLHGLARSDSSMKKMEDELLKEKYTTVNVNYPSRDYPIEILAEKAILPALTKCAPDEEINFVTHSLGGILVRQYLEKHEIPNLNHVVMLGPPNQGSEVVDKLGNFPGFYFINGDAGMQLGTGELSIPNQLGKANFDLGIIAGTRSINWILSSLIPNTDDGKVSVERTKLAGMHDHIEMPVTHPFMMKNDEVIDQVIYYLKHGSFNRD